MVESCKNVLDQKNKTGKIFTDLSKACDTMYQSLLIEKVNAYGFFADSLKFILSYLKNRL